MDRNPGLRLGSEPAGQRGVLPDEPAEHRHHSHRRRRSAGLGPLVDLADPEAAIERVLQITAAEIEQWQANVSRLPRSVYCENGEHERLSNRIRVLASAV